MKKWTALLLSTLLFLTNIPFINAQEDVSDEDYLPLLQAAMSAGAEVEWDDTSQNITLRYEDSVYTFQTGETTAAKNSETFDLAGPPVIREEAPYVQYDDVAFLFEDENEQYPAAKKNIVLTTFAYMDMFSVPGLSIALVDNETGYSWTQGFGLADMEKQYPVTEDTLFAVGSISKTFTALSIMQLVEAGKLSLDEPILTYLPDFKLNSHPAYGGSYRDITLRMLLTHYSGIPGDNFGAFYTTGGYYRDYMDNFLDNIRNQYMDDTTLHRWNYANNGYNLLGYLVAELTSEKGAFDGFIDYTEENIFTPLKMERSSFYLNDEMQMYLAKPYASAAEGRAEDLFFNSLPAGGLYATAKEMSYFMSAILNGGVREGYRVISKESINEMFTPTAYVDPYDPQFKMGLGVYYTTYNGFTIAGHGGDVGSYHSAMQFSPENNLGFFVTTNSTSAVPMVPSYALLSLQDAVREKTGNRYAISSPYTPNDLDVAPADMADKAGFYTNMGQISLVEGQLYIEAYDALLTPQVNGSYYNEIFGCVWFVERGGEECVLLGDHNPQLIGQKVAVDPADSDFNVWIGEYIDSTAAPGNAPLVTKITFFVTEDGFPAARFSTNDGQVSGVMLLQKVNQNTYYVAGTGRNLGKVVVRDHTSPVNKIHYYGTDFVRW